MSNLIPRVTNILKTPKTEWPVIAVEPASAGGLYRNYILLLAAISPICGLIRGRLFAGITDAVISYALALVSIYVLALIIDALAPTFGGQRDRLQALKAAAYAATASWVAGVGQLIPWLGLLIIIGGAVYSFYLLYLGLPHTMKAPADRAAGYTVVVVVVAIVLGWIIAMVRVGVIGERAVWLGNTAPSVTRRESADPDSALGKLEAWSKRMEAAGKKMDDASKSGSAADQSAAMGAAMSAAMGGRSTEALSVEKLKGFVPATLAGLPRTSLTAERNGMMGVQVGAARASFAGPSRTLALEITDTGGIAGMLAFAGWANIEKETETATGYERTRKEGGRIVHEQWDRSSNSGEYSVVLADRFLVKIEGDAENLEVLKSALGELDLAGLEALRNEGVKTQQ